MARSIGADIDYKGLFAVINAKIDPRSADPSSLGAGDEGRVWVNTTTHKLKYWNGTTAIDLLDLTASSGNLTASRISDFASAVAALRWGTMTAPNADVPMNGFKFTGMADGVAGSDSATYGQVLQLINNQVFKQAVRAATTANITLSAPQTVDGVAVIAEDRVLVKDQSSGGANGIYVVKAGAWVRATDFDVAGEAVPGSIVPVAEGTANGDKLFMMTTNGPITLGTTALVFLPYGASSGEIGVAGAGLTKTGVTYDVVGGVGITVAADLVSVDTARIPTKWQGVIPTTSSTVDTLPITIAGNVVTFNHGRANNAPMVVIRAGSTPVAGYSAGEIVDMSDVNVDNNNARVTLPVAGAPAANNWYFMVVA